MAIRPSNPTALPFLPKRRDLASLKRAAKDCEGCDLFRAATQTVFGKGPAQAALMFVGEQPGDQEDKAGEPFVGPAGKLFVTCLDEAGIDRDAIYVTNAVKHFKWESRGKRRLHEKPNLKEVNACHPWLDAEIKAISPQLIVCLGATAAQAILGPHFRVTKSRGMIQNVAGYPPNVATVHPSSILRARTSEEREKQKKDFVVDLIAVAKAIAKLESTGGASSKSRPRRQSPGEAI
jgi:uracil-DNA glycosylase family protein